MSLSRNGDSKHLFNWIFWSCFQINNYMKYTPEMWESSVKQTSVTLTRAENYLNSILPIHNIEQILF